MASTIPEPQNWNEEKARLECERLSDSPSWWRRNDIGKLLFEKLLLVLILAAVTLGVDVSLQRFQGRITYQQELFASRRNSYEEIVRKAQIARDRVLYLHSNRGTPIGRTEAGLQWNHTFSQLRGSAHYVGSGSSGGSIGNPWSVDDVLATVTALEELDRIRNDSALFISQPADRAIDDFLQVLTKDVGTVLAIAKEKAGEEVLKMEEDPNVHASARSEVITAYRRLLEVLREQLRIDKMILG